MLGWIDDTFTITEPIWSWILFVAWLVPTFYLSRRGNSLSLAGKLLSAVLFLAVAALIGSCGAVMKRGAREEILSNIDSSCRWLAIAPINVGLPPLSLSELVGALTIITPESPHHSHPTFPILTHMICTRFTAEIQLKRDSDNPSEYWIFYPKYHYTASHEIGHVVLGNHESKN